jgi:hypothetical protein
MNKKIRHKFSLYLEGDFIHTMYTELDTGEYYKTFLLNGKIISELIDIHEYALALSMIMLPPTGLTLWPNKLL